MSNYKIPYYFDTPVPAIFRKKGWHKDTKAWAYITWAFSRCRHYPHNVYWKPREIELEPFEFISGRKTCSEETGLSEQEVRNQQNKLILAGYLQKSTSKSTNKYTVYKWVTSAFNENSNQQINRSSTSNQPANEPQNRYIANIDNIEQQTENEEIVVVDFSVKENENDAKIVPIYNGWNTTQNQSLDIPGSKEHIIYYQTLVKNLENTLKTFGFSEIGIADLRKNYLIEQVQEIVAYTQQAKELRDVPNPAGYMVKLLKEGVKPIPQKLKPREYVAQFFEHGGEYQGAICWIGADKITFERGQGAFNQVHAYFDKPTFHSELEKALKRWGIDIEQLKQQQTG